MLSEISQRKTNTVWYHLYFEYKTYNKVVNETKKKQTHRYREQKRSRLTDIENKLVVTNGEREGRKGKTEVGD